MAQRTEVGERLTGLPCDARGDAERLASGGAGEADGELGEHADIGAAKPVDRLLSVADDQQAAVSDGAERRNASRLPGAGTRPEQLEQIALYARRILELVDEQGVDPGADLIGDIRAIAQELARRAKNLAEPDRCAFPR